MKRCPQCEFIYEDDQQHCDMDGAELSVDAGPLPFEDGAMITTAAPPSRWRSLLLLAIAGVVLAGVLFVDYYNFAHQSAPRVLNSRPELQVENPELRNVTPETPAPLAASEPSAPAVPRRNHRTENFVASRPSPAPVIKANTNAPIVTLAATLAAPPSPPREEDKPNATSARLNPVRITPSPAGTTQKPASVNQKKESKLGSFLKKTGRILKRPFTF